MRLISVLNLERGDRPLPPRKRALSLIYIGIFLSVVMLLLLFETTGFLKNAIPGNGTIVLIKQAWRSGKSLKIKYFPRLSVVAEGWLAAGKGDYSLGQPISFLFEQNNTQRLYDADLATARIPTYLAFLCVGFALGTIGFIWLKQIDKRG